MHFGIAYPMYNGINVVLYHLIKNPSRYEGFLLAL